MSDDIVIHAVHLKVDQVSLPGDLHLPDSAQGLVIFVHGSGSSRLSPRNRKVAETLNKAGLATLLFDLLTEEEDRNQRARFDITLLARRLLQVVDWAAHSPMTKHLHLGLFGASTGAAAAIITAASPSVKVEAVVSRGGRADLASEVLPRVRAPTLLIVGGDDEPVLTWNREAYQPLQGEKSLQIIPGATHLFEEQGAMEQVCCLAADWFCRHLCHTSG